MLKASDIDSCSDAFLAARQKLEQVTIVVVHMENPNQQVRLVSVKAERPNHPSHSNARQGGVGVSQWGVPVVWGVLHDTYMTPSGRFNLQSRSA